MVCMLVRPPIPVPWVLATRLGCTQRMSSAGVNPEDRNASTVATMFHSATRSTEPAISALIPHLRVEPGGDLAADGAGQRPCAAPGSRCRPADHLPIAGSGTGRTTV